MGTPSFVSDFVDGKYEALRISLDKLSGLHCSHSASLILRSCVGASKVTYLLRVLSPSSGRILAKAVSSLLQSTWSDICGASLEAATWDLATLPVRLGGSAWSTPSISLVSLPSHPSCRPRSQLSRWGSHSQASLRITSPLCQVFGILPQLWQSLYLLPLP